MKQKTFLFTNIILCYFLLWSCSMDVEKEPLIKLTTSMGEIKLKLYNDTPGHRDNFLKLVKEGFYDGITFHRVIEDFMIQAGDPSTNPKFSLDTSDKFRYTIPAEITASHFHHKGALAAARTGDRYNPDRRSSGTQFYIVQGKRFEADSLETGEIVTSDKLFSDTEKRINAGLKQNVFYKNLQVVRKEGEESGRRMDEAEIQELATLRAYDEIESLGDYTIPSENRFIYKNIGGTPHLDMQYTVFGEVVEGLEIIDLIATAETDIENKPVKKITIIKARVVRK